MVRKKNTVVGLDIGTSKICAIIGRVERGEVDILGFGVCPSYGLKKGMVVNVEATVNSIDKAIKEAELMAGFEIDSVCTGISGSHVKGFDSQGVVAVKNREIKEGDIKRAFDAALGITIPRDREIIHILLQEFIVDDQRGIRDPLGMSGSRLEVKIHIVTGAITSARNIVKCVNRTGLHVEQIILQQLASSESALTSDEKELGAILIDIGGGTTDLAIFYEGNIKYTSVLPIGGNQFTSDIALGLRTPISEAERLKKESGLAIASLVDDNDTIRVSNIGEKRPAVLSKKNFCEIIELRAEELFSLINKEVMKSGYENFLGSGVILTGGAATLAGLPRLSENILKLSTRIGYPNTVKHLPDKINNPMYATGVGLILCGTNHSLDYRFRKKKKARAFRKTALKLKAWIGEVF